MQRVQNVVRHERLHDGFDFFHELVLHATYRVAVPMVDVREVGVLVRHCLVNVAVRVRLFRVNAWRVRVLVMLVVRVLVSVFERLVSVQMFVAFGEVKPNACSHQNARSNEKRADGFMQQPQRNQRANKRSERKIGAGARGSDVA